MQVARYVKIAQSGVQNAKVDIIWILLFQAVVFRVELEHQMHVLNVPQIQLVSSA